MPFKFPAHVPDGKSQQGGFHDSISLRHIKTPYHRHRKNGEEVISNYQDSVGEIIEKTCFRAVQAFRYSSQFVVPLRTRITAANEAEKQIRDGHE